jgi:MFS family permease
VTRLRLAAGKTFRALEVRNYRLYFFGQVVSVSGTWMQSVALGWLVLRMTGSGIDLGLVTALQFVPMLLLGSWGGLVADRLDKRRVLFCTQSFAAALALVLGLLDLTGAITLWQIYLLAVLIGVFNLFDNPARQSFVSEMVGKDLLPNAVSLNSVVMNSARVVGPALAGVLIATVGIPVCFLANSASFVAVIVALALMRTSELAHRRSVERAKGQVREGLRYVWSEPRLRDPLLVMAVVGIFAFNFQTTLPLLARFTFHGGAGTFGALTSAMGAGAVLGGLYTAHRARPSLRVLSLVGVVFGALILALSLAPTKISALVVLVPMGAASIAFIATANASLQLSSKPTMRGRVMALYAIAFLGSTPIGAPIVGAVSTATSPRVALALGGVATVLASVPLFVKYGRRARQRAGDPQTGASPSPLPTTSATATAMGTTPAMGTRPIVSPPDRQEQSSPSAA